MNQQFTIPQEQIEIDFKYEDALATADNVITFRWATKTIAAEYGLYATFMPKPLFGVNGNGMHCNMSLFKDGANSFFNEQAADGLSDTMKYFTAGILEHVRSFTALTNPLVNSYKRLVPGYEAPVYLAWSKMNRSALVRVPASRGAGTRIELRSPDPSCNPYLAFAAMLEAGLDGIERKAKPPAPVDENIYNLELATLAQRDINALPGNLDDAIKWMEKSDLVNSALGDHIYNHYIETKYREYQDYRASVSQWELDHYLHAF